MVGDNCVLFPRKLEFRIVEVPETSESLETHEFTKNVTDDAQATVPNTEENEKVKRETNGNDTVSTETTLDDDAVFTGKLSSLGRYLPV